GQSAPVNTAFAAPLVAIVTDAGGNPVSGALVAFGVPSSGAAGSFAGQNTAVTDTLGVATSGILTANGITGAWQAIATVAGATTGAAFSLTNTAGSGGGGGSVGGGGGVITVSNATIGQNLEAPIG